MSQLDYSMAADGGHIEDGGIGLHGRVVHEREDLDVKSGLARHGEWKLRYS